MRNLLFAFVLLVASCSANPAFARELDCVTVEPDSVDQGIASVRSGNIKGAVIQGKPAVDFAAAIGITADVLAAFLVEWEGKDVVVLAIRANGQTAACYGEASPEAVKTFRKHVGRGV